MEQNTEKYFLQQCLLKIEEQLGWGESQSWHSDVFNELSDEIQRKTNVLLSATTLKRVWGRVKYDSAPSISTLNTLAQFAGYANWRDFKSALQVQDDHKQAESQEPKKAGFANAQRTIVLGATGLVAVILISFFSMTILTGNESDAADAYASLSFECTRVSEELPSSVVFDLSLGEAQSDSMFIQQFWDPSRTIRLHPGQEQATGIYYYPGYFRARLLIEGDTIQQQDLFIKSNGWAGTIDYKPIPKYIAVDEFKTDSLLRLDATLLAEIRESEKPVYSTYHFIDDLNAEDGDNFRLKAELRNTYNEKWAVCELAGIFIIGSKGAMIIPLSALGCIAKNDLMLNDVLLDGRENDLSAFGVGLDDWRNVEIVNANRSVSIIIDNKEVYSSNYSETFGKLVGVRFKFLGAGEVRDFQLVDGSGKPLINQ